MPYFGIPGVNDNTEGLEYKQPIPIDDFLKDRDSTPIEAVEVRSRYLNQEGRKQRVRVPFEGGYFLAKPNTSMINPSDEPIITFYHDNSEYNAANMENAEDLIGLQQIFTTVAGAGAALAGAKPQAPNIVLKNKGTKVTIPVTQQGMKDAKDYARIINEVGSLSRFKRIHSYENRPVHIPKEELAPFQKGEPLMSTTGGLVPKWDFDFEGSQFSNTSDAKGLNKPGGLTPQQERNWYSKLTYQRVKEEVLAQGGTKFDADRIFAKHRANFKTYKDGGKGLVSTITELNNMFQKWAPGIQVRTEKYTRNGQDMYRWTFKDVDGKRTRWDFEREDIDGIVKAYSTTTFAKDHLIPVKDTDRTGGGYYGADNPGNFEILYQFVNIQKSNTTQLHPAILKEMGVPNSLSEYINMELYPQNYEGASVPQRWKENFQKIVLADYYEKVRGLKSINKRNSVMQKLISKHSTFFKDPLNIKGLEMLEEALGQQVAKNMEEGVPAGNEVPAWLGLLQRPPGGWNSKDPWWNSLPDDAKQRYQWMYEYRDRTITQPYRRPPQGSKEFDL